MILVLIVPADAALPQPPGPSPLPLVGNLPTIGLGKAIGLGPQPHVRMAELAEEFGDVMTLSLGREPWVVLSSPEVVHEAFITKASDFSGRPMVPSMSISAGGGKAGFARAQLTPELKCLRQAAFANFFGAERTRAAAAGFEEEAELMARHLVASSSSPGGAALRPALRRAVTNMVLRYCFSTRVPHATELAEAQPRGNAYSELCEVVEDIWDSLTATTTTMADLVASEALTEGLYTPLRRAVSRRDRLIRQIVAQRRVQRRQRAGKHGALAGHDMLDALLDARLSDDEILYSLVDMFVAGVNTVSTTLEWLLLLLTKHPQVQARARSAARACASRERAPYVSAVLKEVMRAKPPLLLPRQAVKDSTIGGYAVPAGRIVLANNWALTQGAAWWHAPEAFRPERWLEEEARLDGSSACKFIPYSVGQRACPGSRLAETELSAVAHTLLRQVRWSRCGPLDLSDEYTLTLRPAREQRLHFTALAIPHNAADAHPSAPRASSRARRVSGVRMKEQDGGATASDGASGDMRPRPAVGRATRRQTLSAKEIDDVPERYVEAAADRRSSWRANKAKGNRRNRRYEKRLLQNAGRDASSAGDLLEECE